MKFFVLALTAFITMANAIGERCGTFQAMLNRGKNERLTARSIALPSCAADYYYDSVYTRNTDHFQFFYTLNGPHATTEKFVDSAAVNLEKAWTLHVSKTGMKHPVSSEYTLHYKQKVSSGLYPVEILEINMIRNIGYNLGNNYGCKNGCFGITLSTNDNNSEQTELVLDNDFFFIPQFNRSIDTLRISDSLTCTYPVATEPLVNEADYSIEWEKGIRVTAYHELYHAIQLRYLNLYSYRTFWFEASASGVEEIGAPDVNDYFAYLPRMFSSTGIPLDQLSEEYGLGILYVYLYDRLGKNFDKSIWESFHKNPSKGFAEQLQAVSKNNHLSADSLFHDFVSRLVFAGSRSSAVDSSFWISRDQPQWPTFQSKEKINYTALQPLAYDYYSMPMLDVSNFRGKATVALYKDGKAMLRPIVNTQTLDSVQTERNVYDSLTWIVSRYNENEVLPEEVTDPTLRAYPTPWRSGQLCFTPLPKDKQFIEIRNRRGNLVMRQSYDSRTLCIDEMTVKQKMVPGVYRFRPGTKGKTKDFLIIY